MNPAATLESLGRVPTAKVRLNLQKSACLRSTAWSSLSLLEVLGHMASKPQPFPHQSAHDLLLEVLRIKSRIQLACNYFFCGVNKVVKFIRLIAPLRSVVRMARKESSSGRHPQMVGHYRGLQRLGLRDQPYGQLPSQPTYIDLWCHVED